MKILLYCQHLLGMGHYIRSMALAAGLHEHAVYFINGGAALPDIPVPDDVIIVQLPPIASDATFNLSQIDTLEQIRRWRKAALLELYGEVQPDIILIELFPFGRKKFAFELIPLLEANLGAKKRARVLCSVRDILVTKKDQAQFEQRVCRLVNRYFDAILVHSDARLHALQESFSRLSDLEAEVIHTGYVLPPSRNEHSLQAEKAHAALQITVSAGGGRVGFSLLKTAIQSKKYLMRSGPVGMTVITGPFMSATERRDLEVLRAGDAQIRIESFVPNLCAQLKKSQVSVSMAGYNTCMDILQARVPAVLVPFTGAGNDEQMRRAQALAAKGVATLLQPDDVTPEKLAAAIRTALHSPRASLDLNFSGVDNTRRFIESISQNIRCSKP